MLIGNNNNNFNSFNNPNNIPNLNPKNDFLNNKPKNPTQQKQSINKELLNYSNINSKKETIDKSFLMLQERYNQGLISLEEFTKKCNNLNKLRQK